MTAKFRFYAMEPEQIRAAIARLEALPDQTLAIRETIAFLKAALP